MALKDIFCNTLFVTWISLNYTILMKRAKAPSKHTLSVPTILVNFTKCCNMTLRDQMLCNVGILASCYKLFRWEGMQRLRATREQALSQAQRYIIIYMSANFASIGATPCTAHGQSMHSAWRCTKKVNTFFCRLNTILVSCRKVYWFQKYSNSACRKVVNYGDLHGF